MTVPSVADAKSWSPDVLVGQAAEWRTQGETVVQQVDAFSGAVDTTNDHWGGKASDRARGNASDVEASARRVAMDLFDASAAADAGYSRISAARDVAVAAIVAAEAEQFTVSDDGTVNLSPGLLQTTAATMGGNFIMAVVLLDSKAKIHEAAIKAALVALGVADDETAAAIRAAFALPALADPATTSPQSQSDPWPGRGATGASAGLGAASDRIADEIVPTGAHAAVEGSPTERALAGNALKVVGRVSFVGGMIADGYGGYDDWNEGKASAGEATAGALGSFGGGVAGGALAGAAVGSFLGPIGTGVGAGVGAIIGSEIGKKAAQGLWDVFDDD